MLALHHPHKVLRTSPTNITVQRRWDYITGLPVYGPAISTTTPSRSSARGRRSRSELGADSLTAASSHAVSYLDMYGNPQANRRNGHCTHPDPSDRRPPGKWIQIWENASSVKQMRIASVRYEVSRSRVKQTLSPTAPTPYLDRAV